MAASNRVTSVDRPGSMVLLDHYVPSLRAGNYRLVLHQSAKLSDPQGQAHDHHYHREQRLTVEGPRFSFGPDEIHARFPPAGTAGDFADVLPHVVLRKRALPWERSVRAGAPGPWLALLLLDGDDLRAAGQGAVSTIAAEELIGRGGIHGGGLWLPQLDAEGGPGDELGKGPAPQVTVLDLPIATARALLPAPTEVALLAHVRGVSTAQKVALHMHADGEFAVLVGNRLPSPGENVAHLVSLEGWQALLDGQVPGGAERVRLVSLASWRFVCDPGANMTFRGLLRDLKTAPFAAPAISDPGAEELSLRLGRGFVPVHYQPLDSPGEAAPAATWAWYRGPLSGKRGELLGDSFARFVRPASAIQFDESVDLAPDISYGAAFQLGRLLAISAPAFCAGLQQLLGNHRSGVAPGRRDVECQSVAEAGQRIVNYLRTHRTQVRAAAATAAGAPASFRPELAADLADWLIRLVELHPVPFDYLVADPERLLPRESLRFFHLDESWCESLAAGALSVGIDHPVVLTAKEAAEKKIDRLAVNLAKLAYQSRLRARDEDLAEAPDPAYYAHRTGFLIRSALVAGWPGLDFAVESDAPGDTKGWPAILRLERLGEDLFFGLARGRVQRLTLTEPPEGLRFGVDARSATTITVTPRDPASLNRLQAEGFSAALYRPQGAPGVLDIAALARKCGGAESSARLALHMVRGGDKQSIVWPQE